MLYVLRSALMHICIQMIAVPMSAALHSCVLSDFSIAIDAAKGFAA
jgi:hypothetical protein